jgi:hypothetical protein
MSRTVEAQLTTARVVLAQFRAQIAEFDGMNREDRRTERGRDLAARIEGLREGLATWEKRVAHLEAALAPVGPAERPTVDQIAAATHVRLADGWAEVAEVHSDYLIVGNGPKSQSVSLSAVLEIGTVRA